MANNKFTEQDLFKLQQKGFIIEDSMMKSKLDKAFKIPKKAKAVSLSKDKIELILIALKIDFVKECKFLEDRKFRFDFAVIDKKIAIEYEGVFSSSSGMSRHTSWKGYTEDLNKYNLALINGWKVLRYTALNYINVGSDIQKLTNQYGRYSIL